MPETVERAVFAALESEADVVFAERLLDQLLDELGEESSDSTNEDSYRQIDADLDLLGEPSRVNSSRTQRKWLSYTAVAAAAVIAVLVATALFGGNEEGSEVDIVDDPTDVTDPEPPAPTPAPVNDPEPPAPTPAPVNDPEPPAPTPAPVTEPDPASSSAPSTWSWTRVSEYRAGVSVNPHSSDGQGFYAGDASDHLWWSSDGATWHEVTGWRPSGEHGELTVRTADGRLLHVTHSLEWGRGSPRAGWFEADIVEAGEVTQTSPLPVVVPESWGYFGATVVAAAGGPRGLLVLTGPTLVDRPSPVDTGIDEAAIRRAVQLWVSTDGRTWETAPISGPLDILADSYADGLFNRPDLLEGLRFRTVGVEDGFVTSTPDDGVVWFSPDGATWSEIGSLEFLGESWTHVVPWRGKALALDLEEGSAWKITSAGIDPVPVLFDTPVRQVTEIAVGSAGIAYIDRESSEIVYSPDGSSWTRVAVPEPVDPCSSTGSCFDMTLLLAEDTILVSYWDDSSWRASIPDG